ncbi:adenosylmethionine-8-amino-7-oxononanoate aminotransferase [Bacteroidia bacterium]|nr:adenosylmethionine-8-amino-7-oxononanoate aminotransferase [Bacteroidia bacterium]
MKGKISDKALEFDKKNLWHPYTSMTAPLPVYAAAGAQGVYIDLEDGRRLVDGMSSWWCAVHGYNHPALNRAVRRQLRRMSHVMFGGLTHRPAIELGRRLVGLMPEGLDRIFYCDSGSVAVEVAAKMALQYMQATGQSRRVQLATVCGGYHGDTWQAMSVCDPVGGMHSLYAGRLPVHHFAPRPQVSFGAEWDPRDFEPMAALLAAHHSTIAAVIVEPVVQGAGGMWFYHPVYLRLLREYTSKYGILLIADEIATGFMRTGKMFACQWAGVVPDIMCIGKALTGGYMSFAATVTTPRVAEGIGSSPPGVFMHGPTFMGNPLACAVACASLDLLESSDYGRRIPQIESALHRLLAPASSIDGVRDVRVLGAIGVVEMERQVDVAQVQRMLVERGVWVRPFGRLIYIMPPYIITDRELEQLCGAIVEVISRP